MFELQIVPMDASGSVRARGTHVDHPAAWCPDQQIEEQTGEGKVAQVVVPNCISKPSAVSMRLGSAITPALLIRDLPVECVRKFPGKGYGSQAGQVEGHHRHATPQFLPGRGPPHSFLWPGCDRPAQLRHPSASAFAVSKPIPLLAPVTIATRPV